MFNPAAILLGGFKAAESSKPTRPAQRQGEVSPRCQSRRKGLRYVKAFAFLLLALSFELSAITAALATHIVTNSAGVDWTDNVGNYYVTTWDSASVRVFLQPNLIMAKDVRNLATGESGSDVVSAYRGDTIEFILRMTNTGNTEAICVVMEDSIPAGTEYIRGSALESMSLDPVDPPDTVTFQHVAGGQFDSNDSGTVTAIRWEWNKMETMEIYGRRMAKFRVKVLN